MGASVSPGLFHLPLPMNQDASADVLEAKLVDIERDVKARSGRPEELAIRNLAGLLLCRLERHEDAIEHFNAILSTDKENLNAIANMGRLLSKISREVEAKSFRNMLDGFLGQPTEATVVSKQRYLRARARCLAEQAYAYTCDLHTDQASASRERLIKSNELLQNAVELAGDVIELAEKDMWKFWKATNAHKIFDSLCYEHFHIKAVEHMEVAVRLFYEIANRVPGDAEYKWKSWRNLADIFRKVRRRREISSDRLPREVKRFIRDPEECMKRATELSPENPRLRARYANFLYSLTRESGEPLRLLRESIWLDGRGSNFYAYSARGSILLKDYKVKMRKATEDSSRYSQPDRRMLETARDDLEKAIAFHDAVWDLLYIAEVYHLLAESSAEESEGRFNLEKELEYLRRILYCEDDDTKSRALRLLGRFFFDVGDYRKAIAHFNEAEDLQSERSHYVGTFRELFRCYLSLVASGHKDAKDESVLEEMAQSLGNALIKYGSGALVKYCIAPSRAEFCDEIELFTYHCETIPDYDNLVGVLRSQDPASALVPPVRPGGTLKKFWVESVDPEPAQGTAADQTGGCECPSACSSHHAHTHRSQADRVRAGLAEGSSPTLGEGSDRQETAASVVSRCSNMSVREPSDEASARPKPLTEEQKQNWEFEYDYEAVDAESN